MIFHFVSYILELHEQQEYDWMAKVLFRMKSDQRIPYDGQLSAEELCEKLPAHCFQNDLPSADAAQDDDDQ